MNTHERFEDHDHDRDDDQAGPDSETPAPDHRPLGFLLRVVDRRIAAEIDAVLADQGVTRRDWRRLNLVAGEVRDERMAARLDAHPHKLDDLVELGWVSGEPGAWALTATGREALDALTARVQAVRDRVRSAVSDDDYVTTVASLEAIARALGWDGSTPEPGVRRGRRGPRSGDRRAMRRGPGARRGVPPWFADAPHGGLARPKEDVHVHVHLHDDDGRRHGHRRGRGRDCGHHRHDR
ncbi:MarR family winged helix-turn-helix transcriptional regulator [Agromyces sp. ZXT2-6]|uniref:MarR family winged helix-turn-helix transcriptional regulator n=1 Tax=Agromyces sp. ZXT2-6 TaxID=3461153 RepID=UPI00405527C2